MSVTRVQVSEAASIPEQKLLLALVTFHQALPVKCGMMAQPYKSDPASGPAVAVVAAAALARCTGRR